MKVLPQKPQIRFGVKRLYNPEYANFIIDTVCEYYGQERKYVCAKNRRKDNVLPRQVCMYLLKKKAKASLKKIGLLMSENRPKPFDHTTVLHSIKRIKGYLDVDVDTQRDIVQLLELVKVNKSNIKRRRV